MGFYMVNVEMLEEQIAELDNDSFSKLRDWQGYFILKMRASVDKV